MQCYLKSILAIVIAASEPKDWLLNESVIYDYSLTHNPCIPMFAPAFLTRQKDAIFHTHSLLIGLF